MAFPGERICVITGPARSGKTAELIGAARSLRAGERRVLVAQYQPERSTSSLLSHGQQRLPAVSITSLGQLERYLGGHVDAVLIDNAEHLEGIAEFALRMAGSGVQTVVALGGGAACAQLCGAAGRVVRLRAPCCHCGQAVPCGGAAGKPAAAVCPLCAAARCEGTPSMTAASESASE